MNQTTENKLYTLAEACELLSISTATGRNWMKAGRMLPVAASSGKRPKFEEPYLLALKESLANGSVNRLKSRRNKTYISSNTQVSDDVSLRYELRHCAEQLILSAGYNDVSLYENLLNDLVDGGRYSSRKSACSDCCTKGYIYTPGEDTLGLLYQSLRNMGDRKASGSYYTSALLAKQLVEKHLPAIRPHQTFLDPSCGTGIFLLQLPDSLPLQNIYGTDINPISVTLTRINLALKYHVTTPDELAVIQNNITLSDFLKKHTCTYDIILGNPPWGAKLSADEKKAFRETFSCAAGNSVEIYDLFIEQSLSGLNQGGTLAFVLPEAVLTVKSHTPIRNYLLHNSSVRSVEYLGEAFEQVHCPSIILSIAKDATRPFFKDVLVIPANGDVFSTNVERAFSSDSFNFGITDTEYMLLQKIGACPTKTTLVENADFALGIVTGNNEALLHSTPADGLEPVIKGNDISRYHINSTSGYVAFQPENFQQTAPETFYRAPEKLFYRFINKQLIFAYDNTGLLSLNSCNIIIPKFPGLSVKYVLAVLNSSVAQFFFEKKFHSVKVLRSHLEQIPIPLADEETQKVIVELVDRLMNSEETSEEFKEVYRLLDLKIAELFSLTQEEFKIICN